MSAAKIEIRRKEDALVVHSTGSKLVRQIARPRTNLRCPECNSIIYTRRHKLCAVCGGALPDEMLFSRTEAARVSQVLAAEREQHRTWMKR